MSYSRWVTIIVILFSTTVLIAWDVVVAVNKVEGDTISEIMQGASRVHILLPLAFGILCGHFFWPGDPKLFLWWQQIAILCGVASFAVALDLFHKYYPWIVVAHLEENPLIVFLVGICIGHVVWAQQVAGIVGSSN